MNSILPTLSQFFFLLIVIIAFVAVIKFFRRSLAPKIRKDWQPIALLGTLSVMALLSTMAYFSLTGSEGTRLQQIQKGEILTEKLDEKERIYLSGVDADLELAYRQLEANMKTINDYKAKTYQLNNEYPNHAQFLSQILSYLGQESAEQKKLFNRVNREVRNAHLQSDIQDSVAINKHFLQRAKLLKVNMAKRHKSSFAVINKKSASQVATSVNEARKILVRSVSKTGGKVTKHGFSTQTQDKLLAFLNEKDAGIYNHMWEIHNEIQNAEKNKDKMRDLSMENKDLAQPLIKTMNLWQTAEKSARQHWDDLLYAVEAMYIADQFKMPEHNPAYRSLFRTLKSQSERKLVRIRKNRSEVEQSFSSPEYVKQAS